MSSGSHAERLLQSLGVTEPKEIDLEAIAFHLNARVRFRPIDGCEARIIGFGDNAIITVKDNSGLRRQRFSIAHELGHWLYHRGQTLACRAEDIRPRDKINPERVADGYAADLILPRYLLQPFARKFPKLTTKVIREIAETFQTSLTATAIRLVELGHSPAMLICHGSKRQKWKWFTRGPDVPSKWFPKDQLDADSFAFDILYGAGNEDITPRKIGADAWFDRWEAGKYEICEQTFRTSDLEVVTVITFTNEKMLEG